MTAFPGLNGKPVAARPRSFGFAQYAKQFNAIAKAMPRLSLAGPALSAGLVAGRRSGPTRWRASCAGTRACRS